DPAQDQLADPLFIFVRLRRGAARVSPDQGQRADGGRRRKGRTRKLALPVAGGDSARQQIETSGPVGRQQSFGIDHSLKGTNSSVGDGGTAIRYRAQGIQ